MQDDDWMVPRHSDPGPAEGIEEPEGAQELQIDPQLVQQRKLRKQNLSPHPISTTQPDFGFDRSIRQLPAYSAQLWTLGEAARWIIERTPQAVDGLSIEAAKLFEILPELQAALFEAEVCAFAITKSDPVPRELPAETWSVYGLVIEEKNGLLRVFPLNSSSSDDEQQLLNLRLRRLDVLQRWPDPSKTTEPNPTTIGAENQCRLWLFDLMKVARTQPQPKSDLWKKARSKFPRLGKRGFDRAWNSAIQQAKADNWAAPGRRTSKN